MRRNGHIKTAWAFAKRSREEFRVARMSMDDVSIRQSAEKGWGAAFQAVKGLLSEKGRKPAIGTTRLKEMLLELERSDRAVARSGVYETFTMFLHDLHVQCFGEGDYSVKVIERVLNKLPDFIRTVETL